MSHYKTLGVSETASDEEIRKAYKKLAKQYHPDRNPNNPQAETKFKEISAAYSVLGDGTKKAQYDNERKMRDSGFGVPGGGFGGFGGFGFDAFNFTTGIDPFEILRNAGSDLNIQTALQINFLDAKESQIQPVKFHRKVPCQKCNGSGAKVYHASKCPTCQGHGRLNKSLGGLLRTMQICHTCNGQGKLIKVKCPICKDGYTNELAEINVHIPAGIISGKILRLQGEGHKSIKGKGDLLIKITIAPDRRWKRDGANVHSTLRVDYPTLVLGGDVVVETIWGKEKVIIPPKTKSGIKLVISNKGFPRLGRIIPEERGSHYITLELKVPDDDSKQHKELLQELKKYYS